MGHWGCQGFLLILLATVTFVLEGQSVNGEDGGALEVISSLVQEELEQLKAQFEERLILRQKRSFSRFTYDVRLDPSSNFLEARVSSVFAYPFVCHGKGFVLQSDGIYRLDGFTPERNFFTENLTTPNLKKINSEWNIGVGDRVLHVKEWEQKCFVIVANQNGSFSSIYTLHGDNLSPIFRQQIRNNGIVTAAKFFTFKKTLYLIITNDNAVHALTICPLFRWAGTYMDRIHSIQTRGAVAVETFTINSREYIAIAQAEDPSGNREVGTQILRMDAKEELEKVQLLWSNQPVSLQYVEVLEQHYLVIGQAKEPSIVYLFAGIDFVQVQTLDGYFGPKLFMDYFLLPQPNKGPVLLSAKPASVHFYTWSTTSRSFILTSNSSALTSKYSKQIVSAQFIRPDNSQVFLTVVQNENNRPVLKIYPVVLEKKDVAESQIKETESQLAQCLFEVRKKLDEDDKLLPILMKEKDEILTLFDDARFDGSILVSDTVKVNDPDTKIDSVDVVPKEFEDHGPVITPSTLLTRILEEQEKLKTQVLDQLPNVLMANKPGVISGDYSFLNELEVKQLNAPNSNLQLDFLNNASLSDILDFALRKVASSPQHITGNWSIKKLSANEVEVPSTISNVEVDNFLLKKCAQSQDEPQELKSGIVFKKDVKFLDGIVMPPEGTVNNVTISDVVLKNSPIKDIRGFKHAQNLEGGDGFTFNIINDKNFPEWYNSVLHLKGDPQTSTGVKTFAASKGNKIEDLDPVTINDHDWEEFYTSVLRNVGDQVIEGEIEFERLEVDGIEAESIAGVEFKDLLNTNGTQHISSNITLGILTVQKDLKTGTINGLALMELAVKKNEDAEIISPVELENFKINGNVTLDEFITIAGKDVSEIAKLRRKQTYFSTRSKTITFRAPVEADNLDTKILNGHTWDDLKDNFWSRNQDNVIEVPLNLKGRKVRVKNEFTTGTLNDIDLERDLVRTDSTEPISAKLNFLGDVFVQGDIHQSDEKTLNGLDFSDISERIVKVGDGRVIMGTKTFKSRLVASKGAEIGTLNGFRIPEDLIFLDHTEHQHIGGFIQFKNKAQVDLVETNVDIQVGGKVNGVDLMELDKTTAFKDAPVLIKGNVLFNASFSASEIHVRRNINDIDATDLFTNVIYLTEKQVITFPVRIRQGQALAEGPSFIKIINGITLDDYLPRVVQSRDEAPPYRINGTKTFTNLQIDGEIICDELNGISLMDLSANSLSKTLDQNITGKFVFGTVTIDGDLEVESIGGVNANDLVFINDPDSCSVSTDILFVGDVIVTGPLSIGGFLNGHAIDDILSDEKQKSGLYDREFSEVIVTGNLDWEHNRDDIQGISNFFENAVTLDTDQEITGPVVFAAGFDAEEITADPWIDDVDLKEIQEDAVRIGENPMELRGNNTFSKKFVIKDSLTIQHLEVTRINSVNLGHLDQLVVKRGSHGIVYGIKYFAKGLDVGNFTFKDLGHKGNYNWLVTTNDNRTLDFIEFTDLHVENDLNYNHSKGFDLEQFLDNRVTREGDQVLLGNYTVPSLIVENDCHIKSINGVKITDIFFNNGTDRKIIDGRKTFKNGVSVDGDVETPDINGFSFAALHKDVFRINANEKINRPVVFIQPVEINDYVTVDNHINDYRLEDLSSKIDENLKEIESRASEYPQSPSADKLVQIENMKARLSKAPFWLEFLRLKQDWSVLGPQSRVEFTPTPMGGILGLHQSMDRDADGSYWPEGCQCNAVRFVDIQGFYISTDKENFFPCQNSFLVASTMNNIYNVFDHSLSFNQTCKTEEYAQLVVTKLAEPITELFIGPTKGYLSDVKAFSVRGQDYLILAYFFSAARENHDSSTYVYRVDNTTLTLMQTIPSSGPLRLAIKTVNNDWTLTIANNRDPKTNSCLTNSEIYRWSSSSQNFQFLQKVRTNGAVDVTFLDAEDVGVNYKGKTLNFVAFAQSGTSGSGEVLILQFDPVKKNYYTLQSLRTEWSVTGVDWLCVQENCYLIIVIPQQGVHFYEYRYVEGFQKAFSVPILGARDIAAFSWGANKERILFAIASTKSSLLAEGVIAGYAYEEYDDNYTLDVWETTPVTLQFVEPSY